MKMYLPFVAVAILFASCQKNAADQPVTTSDERTPTEVASLQNDSRLELKFSDSIYQLVGVAASRSGRLFTSYPYWPGPHKYSVVEVNSVNQSTPYPNAEWNSWKQGDDGSNKWVCVQAVYTDDADNLWVLDPASPLMKGVYQHDYKLVKINLKTNAVEQIYRFNYVADKGSYLNDVRVDTATHFAYITNSSEGGIVVVNLATGKMKQVLQGNPSVISDPTYKFTFGGKELKYDYGEPVTFNSDGIALQPGGKWLYYKSTTDDRLYRIETKYLRNFSLDASQVASHVVYLGRFTVTDGMIFDKQGYLYFGDVQHFRIIRIAPDGSTKEIIKDPRLIWPDSYSITDDNYLYITCSQIMLQPEYNFTNELPKTPYTIYKFKLTY